ncbi:MAG: sigma-70 family RNA polymerase sigma factor [Chitinophagaceae bacterium]|nr:sigma-70 family RNA polymerase sigma factor [Chitinophagaceae bacterium]
MKHHAEMPDEKLIQFYLNSNPTALATLTDLYKDRIYNSIYVMVQDKYAAEEIFRKAFISIINNLMAGKNAEDGNFLQWAIQIAQQLCMEYNRKTNLATVIDANTSSTAGSNDIAASQPAPDVMYYESHAKIRNMINMLPEGQREVLVLNHYAGLSLRDIATRMKCSVTTALDTMKTGLDNLRKLMTEQEVWLQ